MSFYSQFNVICFNRSQPYRYGLKYLVLILLCFHSFAVIAQNLVLNPSFEDTCKCLDERGRPYNVSRVNRIIPHWRSPNGGTPDHYRPGCNDKRSAPPLTYSGHCVPHSGENMMGFGFLDSRLFESENSGVREYIETKLYRPLDEGKNYCVSFYIFPAEYSSYRTNRIEVLLSNSRTRFKKNFKPIYSPYSIADTSIAEIKGWYHVKAIYTAKGGERILTIGNFSSNSQSALIENIAKSKKEKKNRIPGAYYFIDDISVEAYHQGCNCDTVKSEELLSEVLDSDTQIKSDSIIKELEESKRIILEDLNFETGSAILNQKEREDLDKMIIKLYEYRTLSFIVVGHTDNQGDEELNKKLSLFRAIEIKDYLVSKGFKAQNIQARGMGSEYPRSTNETPEGRALNRRVEIVILE